MLPPHKRKTTMRTFNNYSNVYKYILPLNGKEPSFNVHCQVQNLFCYFEDYLNLTTNQYERIQKCIAELSLLPSSGKFVSRNISILFGDIHFLFIALEKSYKLSFELLRLLGNEALSIESRNSPEFVNVKQIRNCIEHMDENLTIHDSRYNTYVPEYGSYTNWFSRQFGTIMDNVIELGKYRFAICEESFSHIWNLYDIIFESLQKIYVIPNKPLYDKIFDTRTE